MSDQDRSAWVTLEQYTEEVKENERLREQLVQARTLLRLTFDIARRNENCTWFYDVQKFLTDEQHQAGPDEGLPTHEDVRGILKTDEKSYD